MTIGWLGLVVCVFAAFRVTRFFTADSLMHAFRSRLYRWAWVEPDEADLYRLSYAMQTGSMDGVDECVDPMPRQGGLRTYVYELLTCAWCLGVWVSFAVVAFWAWVVLDGVAVDAYLVTGAAVAGAQGLLAARGDA